MTHLTAQELFREKPKHHTFIYEINAVVHLSLLLRLSFVVQLGKDDKQNFSTASKLNVTDVIANIIRHIYNNLKNILKLYREDSKHIAQQE